MQKEINVKLSYISENLAKLEDMKLNLNDNLENAFNKSKKNKSPNNTQKETKFCIKRENKEILLDKKVKIKELNLKEGDLISVSFEDNKNNIENSNKHNYSLSVDKINEDDTSGSNIEKPLKKRKNFLLIIYIALAIVIIGLIIFLIIHFATKKNKPKKIINANIENKNDNNENNNNNSTNDNYNNTDDNYNSTNDNNENNNNDYIDNKDNINDSSDNDQENITLASTYEEKIYLLEELVTKKRPYYPNNSIFFYISDKIMNVELETVLTNDSNGANMTDIKEVMDFALIIRDESQEIFEEESLIRNWFTGYITLLNLKVNNGTHDMNLNYNKDIKDMINGFDENKIRNLNNDNDSILLNDENEIFFVKIHFYENGEIKDIFYPEDFNTENMVYINTITKLIIPKLSKHLFSENVNEKIKLLNKFMEGADEGEQKYNIVDSTFLNEQNINTDSTYSEKMFSDLKNDYSDEMENENEILDYNISNSSNSDSPKYHLKGIEENDNISTITDFEMENMEGDQAKLEGSLRKHYNYSTRKRKS